MEEKYEKMKQIKDKVVSCTKCPLHKSRKMPVVGEGSHDAKIMFVGEGPGANEDRTGRPFVGRAGKVLDNLLEHIELPREDVYITNLVKCRPPDNRDPHKDEIGTCTSNYLEKQVEIISPKVLSPLGRHAMYYFMERCGLEGKTDSISKIHGQEFEAKTLLGSIVIIPLYHPAVATYNPNMIDTLKEDFEILKKYL